MLPPEAPLEPRDLARWLWSPEDLPDLRLFERLAHVLVWLVTRLRELPQALQRNALRGARRWVNNKRIRAKVLLVKAQHRLLTPLCSLPELVVAHDSSEIDEHGRDCPSDAGPLRSSQARGYMTHWSVACSFDGSQHGAVDAWAWTRSWKLREGDHCDREMKAKESSKWDRGIQRAEKLLVAAGFSGHCAHAEDKEADIFEHLVHQKQRDREVVVRCDLSRQTKVLVRGKRVALEDHLAQLPVAAVLEQQVDSRVRDKALGLTHQMRTAKLEVRFGNVIRGAPSKYKKEPFAEGLPLGLVELREVDAAAGVEPLHWILWSTQPVRTLTEALRVRRIYELRWGGETFFFVCKTGCRLEAEHVNGLASFQRLMVVVMVMATQMVRWVSSARTTPDEPAASHVEPETIQAIREACDFHRLPYPRKKWTLGQLVLLLAQLGGYELRKDKAFGWQVVWRGWSRVEQHRAIVEHERGRRRARAGPGG